MILADRVFSAPPTVHELVAHSKRYLKNPGSSTTEKVALFSKMAYQTALTVHAIRPRDLSRKVVAGLDLVQFFTAIADEWKREGTFPKIALEEALAQLWNCLSLCDSNPIVQKFPTYITIGRPLISVYISWEKYRAIHQSEEKNRRLPGNLRRMLRIPDGDAYRERHLSNEKLEQLRKRFPSQDLAGLDEIPEELQNDPILDRWKCAITGRLVRHPALVQRGSDFYLCEQDVLEGCHAKPSQSIPGLRCLTRALIIVEHLEPSLERLITARLKEISNQIHEVLPMAPRWRGGVLHVLTVWGTTCDALNHQSRQLETVAETTADPMRKKFGHVVACVGKVTAISLRVTLIGTISLCEQFDQQLYGAPLSDMRTLKRQFSLKLGA